MDIEINKRIGMKNGYPEEHELEKIRDWSINDIVGLVSYLHELWQYDDYVKWDGETLELHTGGWSGNEDIIDALRETMFWLMCWHRCERGGPYYFQVTE